MEEEEESKSASRIEFGDWAITSNKNGWQIQQKMKSKDEFQWQSKWFYSSFALAVDALIKKQIRMSNYDSVEQLAKNIESIKSEVFEVLNKKGIDSDI